MTFRNQVRRTCVNALLHMAKAAGLFRLARSLTAARFRILCYHGISLRDEHAWRPSLYMTRVKFAERLEYLKTAGFPVLPLDDAVERFSRGDLPAGATVITFDDGFKDFYTQAYPELSRYRLPSALYVTTYHAKKQTPVFRLIVDYMFWRSTANVIDLSGVEALSDMFPQAEGERHSIIGELGRALSWRIVRFAEVHLSEPERVTVCRQLGFALGVDYDELCEGGMFGIVDEREMRELAGNNVAIQLHTHRHILPDTPNGICREIEDNRRILEPIAGPQRHFCYPSGLWSAAHLPGLRSQGVVSATTCDIGMNRPGHDPLTLRRFLDGSQVTPIRFEAEMCGMIDLARDLKAWLHRIAAGIRSIPYRRAPQSHRAPSPGAS